MGNLKMRPHHPGQLNLRCNLAAADSLLLVGLENSKRGNCGKHQINQLRTNI
jgi:hypothetical protein